MLSEPPSPRLWADAPVGDAEFSGLISRLGPFEPRPRLAVAVSGGADSMALALLVAAWASSPILALVVDHGLRPDSAGEANLTRARLAGAGIQARLLTLRDVGPGAARARRARYAALEQACAEAGILHLLLGHHAADQAETVLMRLLAGSSVRGLAGMAAIVETARIRLLRPLLGISPVRLRATLRARELDWVEDPSNRDPSWQRARLRALRRDTDGTGPATLALVRAAAARGAARAARDSACADVLARRVHIYPQGFAMVAPGRLPPDALAALLAMLAGAARPMPSARLAKLADAMHPCTIGGVQILPAGRLGPGWLLVREAAAIAPPVAARPGRPWDGRFRLPDSITISADCTIGAIGDAAPSWRDDLPFPAAVIRAMPMLRPPGEGVPLFAPPIPAAPASFAAYDPPHGGDAEPLRAPYVAC